MHNFLSYAKDSATAVVGGTAGAAVSDQLVTIVVTGLIAPLATKFFTWLVKKIFKTKEA